MSLSNKSESVIYIVLGVVVTIITIGALLPTIDESFTNLLTDINGSTNFSTYATLFEILPFLFIVSIFILIMGLVISKKNKNK